jgi:hypothetical protein
VRFVRQFLNAPAVDAPLADRVRHARHGAIDGRADLWGAACVCPNAANCA